MKMRILLAVLVVSGLLSACVSFQSSVVLPAVVKGEELAGRGYERIGTVQLTRERFGADVLSVDDYSWAQAALQAEAAKIGADAILVPELSIRENTFMLIPCTEIRARATAIRFR